MAVETAEAPSLPKMTTTEAMIASGVADGLSIAEAGRQVGITNRRNAWDIYQNARAKTLETMDKWGLDERAIVLKIKAKMAAKETKFFQKDGHVITAVDVEAHGIQLQATELAANIRGMTRELERGTSIGTVNILWAGHSPAWAGHTNADTDAQANRLVSSTQSVHTDNLSVIDGESIPASNYTDADAPPVSTLEGTGREAAPSPHTRSAKSGKSTVLTQRSSEAATASATVLTQRVKQKRKPRLPVYRSEK